MLIPFDKLWKAYNIDATGVIHVGANTGQEVDTYYACGIERSIWIEAIPTMIPELYQNVGRFKDVTVILACVADEDGREVDFHVSSNQGQSSSFLELGTHATDHPDVTYMKDIPMTTRRLDTLLKGQYHIDVKDFTFLNMDIQGAELLALKGMGDLLHGINYAYLEVNSKEVYKGCALVEEVDAHLEAYGLYPAETYWVPNKGWGDAFYTRKKVL